MKNIHSINDFKKLFEADKFAADVTFSDSLIGRGFNSIFKILRKSVNKGRLIYFKRLLEDEYIKALLGSIKQESWGDIIKPEAKIKEEMLLLGAGSRDSDDPFTVELGEEITSLPLPAAKPDPEVVKLQEEKALSDTQAETGVKIKRDDEADFGGEETGEKPLVFTRYEEWVKTMNSISDNASEDDVKVIKKIKSELTEISEDINTALAWYKSLPTFSNPKANEYEKLHKENDIFEKEQQYVSKLIAVCDVIINKYSKVEDEISDEEYTKLIANISDTSVDTTKTDVQTTKTDVQAKEDNGKTIASQSDKLTITDPPPGETIELPYPKIDSDEVIYQQIQTIYNKLANVFKNDAEKLTKLKKLYRKASVKAHSDKGGEHVLEPGEKDLKAEIKIMNPEAELNDTNREAALKHFKDRTKKTDVRDPQILKDFYASLKTVESVLATYENNGFRDFTINQKLDEAEMILEKSNKNSRKLNGEFAKLSDLVPGGKSEFGNINLNQLDAAKMKEAFKKNPELISAATNKVNIEAVKSIEYSARLIYDPNISVSNTVLKNFKNNEADAKQYELYWKKMVAKVKTEFHGLLDLNKVDPLKLVNDEETARGGTTTGKDDKGKFDPAIDSNDSKWKLDNTTLNNLGIVIKRPDPEQLSTVHSLIETQLEGVDNIYYLQCDVYLSPDDKAAFKINRIYDGKKIITAGEDDILKMTNFETLKVTDKTILAKFKFGKKDIYYQRVSASGDAGAAMDTILVTKGRTKNHFEVLQYDGATKLNPIGEKVQLKITGYHKIKDRGDIHAKWKITAKTEEEINKVYS